MLVWSRRRASLRLCVDCCLEFYNIIDYGMAGCDVRCYTAWRSAQLESNGQFLGFDVNRMFSHVDVSLSVVFQRNSGPAAWGFSPVPQRATYRSGHTRHLQVHTHSHSHILIYSVLSFS